MVLAHRSPDRWVVRSGRTTRARASVVRKTRGSNCVPDFSPNCPLSFRNPSSHRMVLVGDDSFIGEASFVEMTVSMVPTTFPAWLVAVDLKRETGPLRARVGDPIRSAWGRALPRNVNTHELICCCCLFVCFDGIGRMMMMVMMTTLMATPRQRQQLDNDLD